jgi:hypothetical protein
MELQPATVDINDLVKSLREQRDWIGEIRNLSRLIEELDRLGKVTSVRELSKLINKSKSWIAVSVFLIRGLRIYPEIEKCSNRNTAHIYLMKKRKLRRFLES